MADTPTDRSRDPVFQQLLCELIADGAYLNKSCASLNMDRVEVYAQLKLDAAFADMMESAKEAGFDKQAEELMEIADNDTADMTNRQAIKRAEIRIKTRQWALEKMAPKFSPRMQIEQKSATVAIPVSDDPIAAQKAYETLLSGR